MQKALNAERSWASDRAIELIAFALVVVLAIAMGIAAATLFGAHATSGTTGAPGVTRSYGATQEPVRGNLSGQDGSDGYVAPVSGHGQLP